MTDATPGASQIISPPPPQPVEQLTADAARERVSQLTQDPKFAENFARGDVAARDYWDRLHRHIQGIPPPQTAEGVAAEMQQRAVEFQGQQADVLRLAGCNEQQVFEIMSLRPLTPEQKREAEFRFERMKQDRDWQARWLRGDREAKLDLALLSAARAMPTATLAEQEAWDRANPFPARGK